MTGLWQRQNRKPKQKWQHKGRDCDRSVYLLNWQQSEVYSHSTQRLKISQNIKYFNIALVIVPNTNITNRAEVGVGNTFSRNIYKTHQVKEASNKCLTARWNVCSVHYMDLKAELTLTSLCFSRAWLGTDLIEKGVPQLFMCRLPAVPPAATL